MYPQLREQVCGGTPESQLKDSFPENIDNQGDLFGSVGRLRAFQGDLNLLPSCSIYETCIVPTPLYGCKQWLLGSIRNMKLAARSSNSI